MEIVIGIKLSKFSPPIILFLVFPMFNLPKQQYCFTQVLIPPKFQYSVFYSLSYQLRLCRQLLFDDDIPFSHNVRTIHFFPSGEERGQEDELKVRI